MRKRRLTGMIESLKILLAGQTEAGSAEAQPARDSWLKATNSRWGGSYTPAAPYFESGPFGVLQCLKKPDKIVPPKAGSASAEGRKSLLTVTWICPIHAEPKQTNLVPAELTGSQINLVYATEADVLNMALFGMTAKQWREANPGLKGNIRDYADVSQLVCLSNLENLNAHFINDDLSQAQRLEKLNKIAIHQMKLLTKDRRIKRIEGKST